jgi:hypothetical protein
MDQLDQFLKRCADALHETARQSTIQRRNAKGREADARVKIAEIEDRILFHFPPTKRASRPDLNDEQFKQLRIAEARHRVQLLLTVVSMAGVGNDELPESPLNF